MELPTKYLILTDDADIDSALKAPALNSALFEFDQWLRSEYKYKENEEAFKIREKLHEILNDYNIKLD